jgi:hypothetical protein
MTLIKRLYAMNEPSRFEAIFEEHIELMAFSVKMYEAFGLSIYKSCLTQEAKPFILPCIFSQPGYEFGKTWQFEFIGMLSGSFFTTVHVETHEILNVNRVRWFPRFVVW